jgi:hypothetical protein
MPASLVSAACGSTKPSFFNARLHFSSGAIAERPRRLRPCGVSLEQAQTLIRCEHDPDLDAACHQHERGAAIRFNMNRCRFTMNDVRGVET